MSTVMTTQALDQAKALPSAARGYDSLSPQSEDRELLCRIATRDQQAFECLYTRYASRVRRYLLRRIDAAELVDEVLNDTMLLLWKQPLRCPLDVPLGAWLCGIARYKAYKKLARRQPSTITPPPAAYTDKEDEPEHILRQQEQERLLARAIDLLPFLERNALRLRIDRDYSYDDIAAMTGEPASTIRTRVSRARQRLRAYVAERMTTDQAMDVHL